MSRIMIFTLIVLLATTAVWGASSKCGRHGDDCASDSQCCQNLKCHRYANRCQVQITPEELMAQRRKVLGRKAVDLD